MLGRGGAGGATAGFGCEAGVLLCALLLSGLAAWFGFSALTVVGDGEGRVGMGRGKAREVPIAVQKAMDDARRNMFKVHMKGDTLQYPMIGRHGSARVVLRPATDGTGIVAGGTMRAVFEVMGIQNVLTKVIGTTNPVNVTRATISALKGMRSASYIAAKRGKDLKNLR